MVAKPNESIARELQAAEKCRIQVMYERGVAALPDYDKAVYFFGLAAEQGCAEAQTCLGVMYENGLGVKIDYVKAEAWYMKAAEQGLADAHRLDLKN